MPCPRCLTWLILLQRSGPKVMKLFSCSTLLSMKFIQHINVKMPTIVGILTFIGRINTASESRALDHPILWAEFQCQKVCIYPNCSQKIPNLTIFFLKIDLSGGGVGSPSLFHITYKNRTYCYIFTISPADRINT